MRTSRMPLAGTVILTLLAGLTTITAVQAQGEAEASPGPAGSPSMVEIADAGTVLFVGNSFTFFNGGVENHVAALVASEEAPRPFEVDTATIGGATLKTHYDMGESADSALAKIANGAYDVVILQEDIPELTERSVDPFLEYARLFDEDIREAGSETVFFMTWPYQRLDWVSLEDIVAAHRQIETELGAPVAPVGVAMADALAERPDLAMLGSDAEHESMAGTYLAAAVIYATLFERSPEGLPYRPPSISEDDAAFLQRIAWDTVEAWSPEAAE